MSKQRMSGWFRRACPLAGLAVVTALGVYAAPQGAGIRSFAECRSAATADGITSGWIPMRIASTFRAGRT